eukprot:TRINITY_DN4064_c0_g1_i1.p1 TRINITY_DN4064_c0_g1~~TRINITY_DN4064_c0_g1_i1.p1  ORF type:complete len:563 (+),score=117.04 TRINITY_DN4064_c0_g1_i1:38-1690(+)
MRSAASILLMAASALGLPSQPNFLIMFADDMGYGDPSVAGNPTTTTPNIDSIATEGIRFTQWYSGFHICSPSRAAMVTGRLPIRNGCAGTTPLGGVFRADAVGGLPLNETTFADILSTKGYYTAAVGKWHLGQRDEYLPTSRGFKEYFGVPYSVDMGESPWSLGHDEAGHRSLPLMLNKTVFEQPTNLEKLTNRYAEYARGFMQRMKSAGNKWALYLAWSHVHIPNFCGPEHCGTTKRGRFGDAISELDAGVGVVLSALKEYGYDENTLIFFSSDNGPWLIQRLEGGSPGPLREGKTTTWEGGVREPGYVRWKGVIEPRISTEVVATYDIFPTIIALAGASLPTNVELDGKDMSPLLESASAKSSHKCIYLWKGVTGSYSSILEGAPDEIAAGTNLLPHDIDNLRSNGVPNGNITGLWAVRCGAYKAHFVTNTHFERMPVVHDPPVLYNVEYDIAEAFPISNKSDVYHQQMAIIKKAAEEHVKSIKPQTNEMARGTSAAFDICCDPNSKERYPTLPNCTCAPATWDVQAYTGGDIDYSVFWDPYCSNSPK